MKICHWETGKAKEGPGETPKRKSEDLQKRVAYPLFRFWKAGLFFSQKLGCGNFLIAAAFNFLK